MKLICNIIPYLVLRNVVIIQHIHYWFKLLKFLIFLLLYLKEVIEIMIYGNYRLIDIVFVFNSL